MGNTNSANDEWIELKNNTSADISLSDWILKSTDDKLRIKLTGFILANGFYLLERTDDSSVLNIKADLVYKGALNNNGMALELYDNSNLLVDSANYSSGWPAGDNETKRTAERIGLNVWQTSKDAYGTPKSENSAGFIKPVIKTSSPPKNALTEPKKNANKNSVNFSAAAINSDNKDSSFLIFLISLVLILLSGGIIIYLKINQKLKSKNQN